MIELPNAILLNYKKIPLELHLKVDHVLGKAFQKANVPSNPKSQRNYSR